MPFAVANFAAASLYAAALLFTLALRGDKHTAALAIYALVLAFISAYVAHMRVVGGWSERIQAIMHNVAVFILYGALALGLASIVNFVTAGG